MIYLETNHYKNSCKINYFNYKYATKQKYSFNCSLCE